MIAIKETRDKEYHLKWPIRSIGTPRYKGVQLYIYVKVPNSGGGQLFFLQCFFPDPKQIPMASDVKRITRTTADPLNFGVSAPRLDIHETFLFPESTYGT